jgi:tRNA uridine 5-carboxymethylaminomethyl modification enzyme
MDGGKYASADVSRETLGELSAPVVEQVEIAPSTPATSTAKKTRWSAPRISKTAPAADLDYMQVTA